MLESRQAHANEQKTNKGKTDKITAERKAHTITAFVRLSSSAAFTFYPVSDILFTVCGGGQFVKVRYIKIYAFSGRIKKAFKRG